MYQKLDKVLALVAKTGDKIVVVSENHEPYVVMSLGDYEKLLTSSHALHDLTETELMNKINRDIAIWKAAQVDENQMANDYNLEQFKLDTLSQSQTENNSEIQNSPEITDVDKSTEEEEEKYYLEPVD